MSVFRKPLRAALGAIVLAWCATGATTVREAQAAGSPFLEVVDPAEAMRSPAYRYANMSNEDAFAELDRRHILYTKQVATNGVRAPIRLTGRLHGVHVHSSLPPEARPSTPFEILDARLALSLDDFCAILARHDIDEVIHYTMYRPNVAPPGFTSNAVATTDSTNKGAEPRGASAAAPARSGKAPAPAARPTSRSAKKKAPPRTLEQKGVRVGKGEASPPTRRAGRKDAYGVGEDGDLDRDPSLDEIADDKLASQVDGEDLDLAKAAPKPKAPPPRKAAGGASHSKGSSPTPHPTAIGSTSRRTAAAIRRPPTRSADEGEAEHTHSKWAPPGTRHPAGLAIDVGAVHKRGGRWLSIASHFDGKIGRKTCGVGAPVPEAADAKELQAIVCEAREAGVFTYALTPNFNQDHVDHVHFEIKPGVTWFLYH